MINVVKFFSDDKPLCGLIGVSGFLEFLHRFILAHQADLNAMTSIGQLIVLAFTVYHLVRKELKRRHEKNHPAPPPAPDSP